MDYVAVLGPYPKAALAGESTRSSAARNMAAAQGCGWRSSMLFLQVAPNSVGRFGTGTCVETFLAVKQKPNGRVRALVVGDAFRRLVGRVLASHFVPQFQEACVPHQYGLSTRTGTEAVSRLLRAATEACPRATILSVDAVGAFDHVSRGAMLEALLARRELHPLLPFAQQFYSSPSVWTWCDDLMPAFLRFGAA